MRYTRPFIPVDKRICKYCSSYYTDNNLICPVDDEFHLIIGCTKFQGARDLFYEQCSNLNKDFMDLSDSQKFVSVLCPATAQLAKLVNRYIARIMTGRKEIDEGTD